MKKLKNFINNEWADPQSGKYQIKVNPCTAQPLLEVPDSSEVDVVLAVQSARKAFEKWSELNHEERSKYLNAIADGIEKRFDEFARAESTDVGKPLWLSREMDIPRAIQNFRFFASAILHHSEMSTSMSNHGLNYTLRQPIGVAGLITPWNLPLYLLTWKLAPCLATGNTAVCKPSELTPSTAALLGEVLQEAGLPPGVCNIVFGSGEVAGNALVSHPAVPLISFTGGTVTGEKIQRVAGPQFKKVSLEIGGKNATIVFKDADLNKAMDTIVRSSFLNQGEICLCGSRILVQQDIFDEFKTQFVKKVSELQIGDPFDERTYLGPVISAQHRDKVLSCIEQAKQEKGKVLHGGGLANLSGDFAKGYFIEPTVIDDLTNCSELWQKEIFGPVVTLMPFKYPFDAVKWANTSPYGLSASIWTQDLSRAHKVAAQLQVGTVWVNTWLRRDLRVPFGGVKASGIGREGGEHSIDFFTERKTVCVQL